MAVHMDKLIGGSDISYAEGYDKRDDVPVLMRGGGTGN